MKKLRSIKLLLLALFVVGCANDPVKYIGEHVVPVTNKKYLVTEATAFHVWFNGKVRLITNRHVCNGKPTILVEGKNRRVIKESSVFDICLVEGYREDGLYLATEDAMPLDIIHLLGFPRSNGLTARSGRVVGKVVIQGIAVLHAAVTSFEGNSGSPICNDYGQVVGLLFSGNVDTYEDAYTVTLPQLRKFLEIYAR